MKLITILFVHIYLHGSPIRNIIHAQKKIYFEFFRKIVRLLKETESVEELLN